MNQINFVVAWQLWRHDVVMSFRPFLFVFFFLRCLFEMSVNVDVKWILREAVSTNLVLIWQ